MEKETLSDAGYKFMAKTEDGKDVPANYWYPHEKVKQFIKDLKEWTWKNNTIKLKNSPLRLAITDGGWVNCIELHKAIGKIFGPKLVEGS